MTLPISFDNTETREPFELWFGQLHTTGERVVRKISRGGAPADRLLRNEVAAASRLSQRPGYPAQLCRIVDHDLKAEAPYVTTTHRGSPVRHENTDTALALYRDLLHGIEALARVGLTHGAITPDAVLWDGRQAQLVDLGHAMPIGAPYTADLPPHWLPPSNGSPLRADPSHDVYQAALLVHGVATGAPAADAATMRARVREAADEPLRHVLDGAFADDPGDRPSVEETLRRIDKVREYSPARLDFRRKVAAKRAYRERQARKAAVAWRFAVDLLDVLWHQQSTAKGKLALAVTAAAVAATPFVVLAILVNWLLGGTK